MIQSSARLGVIVFLRAVRRGGCRGRRFGGGPSHGRTHVKTAMTQIGHTWAMEGAIDPAQVGALRACQTRQTPHPLGGCYGPDQIRKAYGFDQLTGTNGAGTTIAIIDAYGSDTIAADLRRSTRTSACRPATLDVEAPYGIAPTTPSNAAGWKGRRRSTSSGRMQSPPAAKIMLVVAKSNNDYDILRATQWLADHNNADVLSQSYGEDEECMGTDAPDPAARGLPPAGAGEHHASSPRRATRCAASRAATATRLSRRRARRRPIRRSPRSAARS